MTDNKPSKRKISKRIATALNSLKVESDASNSALENDINNNNEQATSAYFSTIKNEPIESYAEEEIVVPKKIKKTNVKKEPIKIKIEDVKTEPKIEPANNDKWEPINWREQLDRIKIMRSEQNAPVDTMGCDTLADTVENLQPNVRRFHVLIGLMLSAQTKDEVTAKAVGELQKLPLEIDKILETDEETISKLIYPVSFYKRKAQYIKKTAQILKDSYNYDIPSTVEELCKLPGVGPKMGYLAMTCGWNKVVGIGVDTHVHRISNRLGWTKKQTKTPEHTRKELQEWLPQCHWEEVNHLLVGFGQQTCRPVGPKCDICLCKPICPTGKTHIVKKPSKSNLKIEPQESSVNNDN